MGVGRGARAEPGSDPLAESEIIVTADSVILDRCARWANLARSIVTSCIPQAWVIDLSEPGAKGAIVTEA
jgi:hypothetical protein